MHIGKNLKALRVSRNLVQSSVAETLGVKTETISGYERGKGFPSFEMLIKLAELYQVSLDDLVFRDIEHEGLSGNAVVLPATDDEKENMAKKINELLEHRVRELERYIKEKDPEGAKELGI